MNNDSELINNNNSNIKSNNSNNSNNDIDIIENNSNNNNNDIDNNKDEHINKKYKIDNNSNNNKQENQDIDKKIKREKIKQQQKEAIYGNYHGYYNYRNEKSIEKDPRLKYLKKEYFYQKNCLDIGCNSGDLVFKISKDFHPSKIVGVDIDKYLINKAYKELLSEKNKLSSSSKYNSKGNNNSNINNNSISDNNNNNSSSSNNSSESNQKQQEEINYQIKTTLIDSNNIKIIEKKNFIPISFRMISDGIISSEFPHNITFYCHNFLYPSKSIDIPKSYDVISALSISKWIHLNWGDEGIKKFFFKIYDLLKEGGVFLFEPQPYKGYSKRKNLTELINQNFNQIQFKPNQFIEFLVDEVKFKSFEFLNESEAKSKGFDRPLYKLIK